MFIAFKSLPPPPTSSTMVYVSGRFGDNALTLYTYICYAHQSDINRFRRAVRGGGDARCTTCKTIHIWSVSSSVYISMPINCKFPNWVTKRMSASHHRKARPLAHIKTATARACLKYLAESFNARKGEHKYLNFANWSKTI